MQDLLLPQVPSSQVTEQPAQADQAVKPPSTVDTGRCDQHSGYGFVSSLKIYSLKKPKNTKMISSTNLLGHMMPAWASIMKQVNLQLRTNGQFDWFRRNR